jgi:hypothetical protein
MTDTGHPDKTERREPSRDVPIELNEFGEPKIRIRAESAEAASHWDVRNWRPV